MILTHKYLELKKENDDKLYLFKSGLFYVFLEDDALKISKEWKFFAKINLI